MAAMSAKFTIAPAVCPDAVEASAVTRIDAVPTSARVVSRARTLFAWPPLPPQVATLTSKLGFLTRFLNVPTSGCHPAVSISKLGLVTWLVRDRTGSLFARAHCMSLAPCSSVRFRASATSSNWV